ncbi:MAG TPA: hypothetical protein VJ001_17695 [Rhodocyclaceae bacterium]|nr:hypothetical protein [Rhodocyclaceae bacterium]
MNLARLTLPVSAPSPLRRLKLWDMKDKYHCPVVGTCVSMDELRNFAKRYAFDGASNDEFALHVEAVQRSQQRNDFSVALQKHLDRKYALTLGRFEAARSDADVYRLWRDSLARGDVAAALWATVTHKRASEATRHAVYADIHMLSHQIGAGQAADCRRLGLLERENATLSASLLHEQRESVRREAEMAKRLQALEGELADLRATARDTNEIRERLQSFESGEVFLGMNHRLNGLEHVKQQLCNEIRRNESLEKSLARQRQETAVATRERELLAAEREALESLLIAEEQCATNCTQECEPMACGGPRHVLCVGGRTPLLVHYRALAQRLEPFALCGKPCRYWVPEGQKYFIPQFMAVSPMFDLRLWRECLFSPQGFIL